MMSVTERWTRGLAVGFSVLLAVIVPLWTWLAVGDPEVLWVAAPGGMAAGWLLHGWLVRRYRRRARILRQPFPDAWREVLEREVAFYRALDETEQARFREELQLFCGETRITGINTPLDDETRVLAAASAVIPVFGFPHWEWDEIGEILIYPDRFDEEYHTGGGAGQDVLGMVGNGAMDRVMILSKPDLVQGFTHERDSRNVGIHEFAHLMDKADGTIDGVPGVGLGRGAVGPWLELVRKEMHRLEEGNSRLDDYALTNEAEFFAVAAEHFFERPDSLKADHPELYEALTRVFRQDTGSRFKRAIKSMVRPGGRRVGRNAPCPCGSGRKYKKCCLPG